MSVDATTTRTRLSLRAAIVAAVVATACATALEYVTPEGTPFSWPETFEHAGWKVGLLVLTAVGFAATERRVPSFADLGIVGSDTSEAERHGRRPVAQRWTRAASLALAAVTLTGSGVGYGRHSSAGPLVMAGVFLVRWPISVIAQQTLFFGWLQPRLGRYGLVAISVLFTAYHLPQQNSLLYIAPFAVIMALRRWQSGSIRSGIALHYGVNVALFVFAR